MGSFPQVLKSLRDAAGISQADLARAATVGQKTISQYEDGSRGPTFENVIKLAKALGVGVEAFDPDRAVTSGGEAVAGSKREVEKRTAIREVLRDPKWSACSNRDVQAEVERRNDGLKCGRSLVSEVRAEMAAAGEIERGDRKPVIKIRGGYVSTGRSERPVRLDRFEFVIIGRTAAGTPIDPQWEEGERLVMNDLFRGDLSVVRVVGNSMTGLGILTGDYAVVRRQSDADRGQIVVAWVDGCTTLKRLDIRGTGKKKEILLHAHGEQAEPIRIDPDVPSCIIGVYVGIIRRV